MAKIVIVSSCHTERPPFMATTLLEILLKLEPEAVFLEETEEDYERSVTLESKAANLYLQKIEIPIFPAGLVVSQNELLKIREKYRLLVAVFEKYGTDGYQALYANHSYREAVEGFSYLNSKDYLEVQRQIRSEEERIIDRTGRKDLAEILDFWNNLQGTRERHILVNVKRHMVEGGYKNAVLVVGAEHLNSVMEKTRSEAYSDFEWSLYEH